MTEGQVVHAGTQRLELGHAGQTLYARHNTLQAGMHHQDAILYTCGILCRASRLQGLRQSFHTAGSRGALPGQTINAQATIE